MLTRKNEPRSNSRTSVKWIALLPMMLLCATAPANADDIFVQIADIKGESRDDMYREAIDALSWNWGMQQSGSTHTGKGGGAGRVNVNDLTFTHFVDKTSPKLMEACSKGQRIPSARLSLRMPGGSRTVYMVIDMEDVLVTSVSTGGSGGASERAVEEVTLNFARVRLSYRPVAPDGKVDAPVEYSWDVKANREL